MYTPKHFEVKDRKEALSFIRSHSFGQLISIVDERLFSTHLPFLLSENGNSLFCHVAKNNPQWQTIEQQEVLITYQGDHGYISPTWLNSPAVPTWNYQAVHVYGRAKIIEEPVALKALVDDMTRFHEASMATPWEPKYAEQLLNVIVGIEIRITDIQAKYKLSQNKSIQEQIGIAAVLSENGVTELSKAMKTNDQ